MDKEKHRTVRQEITSLLTYGQNTARDLSQALGIREKEVLEHLPNIEKTLKNKKQKLMLFPYKCLSCNFEFTDRKKFSKPGKCPVCKKQRIEPAVFWIE